jgi:hypothetical protein
MRICAAPAQVGSAHCGSAAVGANVGDIIGGGRQLTGAGINFGGLQLPLALIQEHAVRCHMHVPSPAQISLADKAQGAEMEGLALRTGHKSAQPPHQPHISCHHWQIKRERSPC